MKPLFLLTFSWMALAQAQDAKIAVVGLQHSHVWGHLPKMIEGKPARLVGIAETIPALIVEATKMGAASGLIFSDAARMLDETKPDIVWAFTPNNDHLRIVKLCAARKINVMFEKPLASTLPDARAIRDIARSSGIVVLS